MDELEKNLEEHKTVSEKYRIDDKKETVGDWLKKRMSWIILIASSILFIFKEGLDFSRTGKDIVTIILGMGLTYLFTIYISVALRRMGKKSGKDSATYKNSLKYLAKAKNDVKEFVFLLPRFCRYKYDKTLEEAKRLFIERYGLSFKLYNDGYYKNEQILATLTPKQVEALNSINDVKVSNLDPTELLSEHSGNKTYDPLYLGKSEAEDDKQSGVKIAVTKLFVPIITGYLSVTVALGSGLLWGAIQVGIILLIGLTNYMEGEDYVTNELRNRNINKADHLIDFKTTYENQQNVFEEELKFLTNKKEESQQTINKQINKQKTPSKYHQPKVLGIEDFNANKQKLELSTNN